MYSIILTSSGDKWKSQYAFIYLDDIHVDQLHLQNHVFLLLEKLHFNAITNCFLGVVVFHECIHISPVQGFTNFFMGFIQKFSILPIIPTP